MAGRIEHGPAARREIQKLSVVEDILLNRRREISAEFGTATHSGSDPAKWKPFHSQEQHLIAGSIIRVAHAAGVPAKNIPVLMLTASLAYPDFNDIYLVNTSRVKQVMREATVFSDEDLRLVDVSLNAVKKKHAKIDPKQGYVKEQGVIIDAYLGLRAKPDALYQIMLLALERLIAEKEEPLLLMSNGQRPRSLAESLAPGVIYNSAVLRTHFSRMEEKYYEEDAVYTPALPSTLGVFSRFEANQKYFLEHIKPSIKADDSEIDLPQMFREAASFSQTSDGWLARMT